MRPEGERCLVRAILRKRSALRLQDATGLPTHQRKQPDATPEAANETASHTRHRRRHRALRARSQEHSSSRESRSTRLTTSSRPTRSSSSALPTRSLLDIGLPGIDGLFYCGRLRENPRTRKIPIIAISGSEQRRRVGDRRRRDHVRAQAVRPARAADADRADDRRPAARAGVRPRRVGRRSRPRTWPSSAS